MRAGFEPFALFPGRPRQPSFLRRRSGHHVLAVGGEQSFGATMAAVMRFAASDVQEQVIPDAGHWLMEEQPDATVAAVVRFVEANPSVTGGRP